MCEIAAVDPERTNPQQAHQLAGQLYHEQGDGLGMVIVKRNEEEERFEYETFTQVNPHWQTWWAFMRRNWDDAWRIFIHGRKLSAGEVNRDSTHPIEVDCPHCETNYILHNGTLRNHQQIRAALTNQGHSFNTKVDSEVIAHKVGEIPETLDDVSRETHDVTGSVNYLLFAEDRILIHTERKYYVTDDLIITCRNSKDSAAFDDGDLEYGQKKVRWAMATPDGEVEIADEKKWATRGTGKYSTSGNSNRSGGSSEGSWSQMKRAAQGNQDEQETTESSDTEETTQTSMDEDSVVEVYEELLPTVDGVSACEVAPGVIKVVDDQAGTEFVRRRDEPQLYYYYATHRTYPGDETIKIADLFDEDGNLRDAEEVNEAVEKAKEEAAVESMSSTTLDRIVERVEEGEEISGGHGKGNGHASTR